MPIKVNFKGRFDSSDKNQHCVLTVISMNSEKQLKENFKAFVLALNNKYELGEVYKLIIIISAGLHLHYIKLNKNLTEEQARAKANEMDKEWKEHNQESLNLLKCELEILSWNELFKNDKTFKNFLTITRNNYESDKEFRENVIQHSGSYYANKLYKNLKDKIPGLELQDCAQAAIDYVLEECAALKSFDQLASYLVYPGEMNPCFKYVYQKMSASREIAIQFKEYKFKTVSEEMRNCAQKVQAESKRETRSQIKNLTTSFFKNASVPQIHYLVSKINELLQQLKLDDSFVIAVQEDTKQTQFMILNKVKKILITMPAYNADLFIRELSDLLKQKKMAICFPSLKTLIK